MEEESSSSSSREHGARSRSLQLGLRFTSARMVLLHLTERLLAQIDGLQLPTELAALVASHVAPSSFRVNGTHEELHGAGAGIGAEQTISHEVLVKISKWTKEEGKGESRSG
jgi:hypothetical protein